MSNLKSLAELNALTRDTLMGHLSINYTQVGSGSIQATMPVDATTVQPFGRLHGGAAVALAESVASAGSYAITDEKEWIVVGTEVSASHVGGASSGIVTATGKLLYQGKIHHVWEVKIHNEAGKLISVSRITNTLMPAH